MIKVVVGTNYPEYVVVGSEVFVSFNYNVVVLDCVTGEYVPTEYCFSLLVDVLDFGVELSKCEVVNILDNNVKGFIYNK